MTEHVFHPDFISTKELIYIKNAPIEKVTHTITADVSAEAIKKGEAFAKEKT